MQPDYYRVNGGQQLIHFSHFVRAPGAALPMRLRMINGGWDDSRLRRCLEDVKDAVAAKGDFLTDYGSQYRHHKP